LKKVILPPLKKSKKSNTPPFRIFKEFSKNFVPLLSPSGGLATGELYGFLMREWSRLTVAGGMTVKRTKQLN
jgi:hypothetical protein